MIKLNVTTHSGADDLVEVEVYSADDLAEKLNDDLIHVISLGGNIYSRIDVKSVKPFYKEEEEKNTVEGDAK